MFKYKFKSGDTIIWLLLIIQLTTAICLFNNIETNKVTRIYYISNILGVYTPYLYLSSALVGYIGLNYNNYYKGLVLLMIPQNIAMINCIGVLISIYRGVYPNGHQPKGGSAFILADQISFILLFFFVTLEISKKWAILILNKNLNTNLNTNKFIQNV